MGEDQEYGTQQDKKPFCSCRLLRKFDAELTWIFIQEKKQMRCRFESRVQGFIFFFESANVSPLLGFFVIVSHGYLPANLLLTYKIS